MKIIPEIPEYKGQIDPKELENFEHKSRSVRHVGILAVITTFFTMITCLAAIL